MNGYPIHAATIAPLRLIAAALEEREQARLGGSRDAARARLARRLGMAPGTLYNLARDRLKRVDGSLRERLTAYAIRDLEAEIARLTHELEIARALADAPHSAAVAQIRALIERAQQLLADVGAE